MRITHLLLIALSLSLLALSPCYADEAQNKGNSNNSVLYKAVNDNGYVLLHCKKDCPFLKDETIIEVSPLDKNYASAHPCLTCGTSSFNSSSNSSQPSNNYIPSSQTVSSSPSYSSSPASEYYPSSSYSGTRTTYTGPRGGRYHYSASGKKVYERKKR